MTEINYQKIAELDPLAVDEDIVDLPRLNCNTDISRLVSLGNKMTANFYAGGIETPEESYAALRDMDFIASSIDRIGQNPFAEVNELEEAMLDAGSVAGSVPRGTITTYAAGNPAGVRRRSFTGSQEEDIFLDSLKTSFDELEIAFKSIADLRLDDSASTYTNVLRASIPAVGTLVSSMVDVKRAITPEYFTKSMRPFFDPLTIGGRVYAAAGGGQLQLVAIEKMVYGIRSPDLVDYKFFEENFPYLNVAQRQQLEVFSAKHHGQSILALLEAGHYGREDGEEIRMALLSLTRTIRKFRYPHRRVAVENFKLRPAGSVGSGSYTPVVLTELISETEDRLARIWAIRHENK